MTDFIVRAVCALLTVLFPPTGQRRRQPEPDYIPEVRPPAPRLPRHKSPQAADTGPLPATGTTRRYAPAVWHTPDCAANRLTQGRRRAELWLATHGLDAPWPVRPHGVPLGGTPGTPR